MNDKRPGQQPGFLGMDDVVGRFDERLQALEEKAEWARIHLNEDVADLEKRANRDAINTGLRFAEVDAEMTRIWQCLKSLKDRLGEAELEGELK